MVKRIGLHLLPTYLELDALEKRHAMSMGQMPPLLPRIEDGPLFLTNTGWIGTKCRQEEEGEINILSQFYYR